MNKSIKQEHAVSPKKHSSLICSGVWREIGKHETKRGSIISNKARTEKTKERKRNQNLKIFINYTVLIF